MVILIIQTIVLVLIMLFFTVTLTTFAYVASLILGFIPFLYLKKLNKKEILKINIISSIIVAVIFLLIYFMLIPSFKGISPEISEGGRNWIEIINIKTFLPTGLVSIVIFNIPFILYSLFKKENPNP